MFSFTTYCENFVVSCCHLVIKELLDSCFHLCAYRVMDALALGKSGEHSSSSSCSRLCLEQPLRVSRALQTSQVLSHSIYARQAWTNYRLTHSASELSGFTCTRSLTMNEKFEYRKIEAAECGIENFEFIVSERVQVITT